MVENLKLGEAYDGFLYLAESRRHPAELKSHRHVELELNLVVRGDITYVVNGRRYTFHPRALLWLFPEQEHQLIDFSDDAQCYVAVFKPALIADSCKTAIYEGLKGEQSGHDGVLNAVLEPNSFDLIRKTMDSLMQGAQDPDLLNREAGFGVSSGFSYKHGDPDGLNAGLRHLLLLSWRSQRGGKVFGDAVVIHPAVQRALKLLSEGHWDQDLQTLARACGLSDAHLSRTFHRQIGVPLSRYRNSLRLARFWEQYRQPEGKTLTEAVYAAGFGSYAQFYKVFVGEYGRGPRECIASQDS